MKSFPMFIKTTGRRVVICGGGEQAAQKARLILKTDAQIVLAAPELEDELGALVASGRAELQGGQIGAALFEGAAMAFIASGCPGIDASLHGVAQGRCPVNVVDRSDLCDITTPSIVDRDPVVVAIGTEGTAPVLARQIKTRLEEILPMGLGGLAALSGRLRGAVTRGVAREKRRAFWAWVFTGSPGEAWARGAEREAARAIKEAIAEGGAPGAGAGAIALVAAGPGARDLMTLRAVQRLQEADVIFYDRAADTALLELARRDAERVFVGRHEGAAQDWPQEKIGAVISGAARTGQRVVWLKSGDRAEIRRAGAALADGDVPVEIVPGVAQTPAAGSAVSVA